MLEPNEVIKARILLEDIRMDVKRANKKMKIVIGHDGSEYSDAALDDLIHAGLPRDAEALIISVAEG